MIESQRSEYYPLRRREVVAALLQNRRDDLLVIAGLGSTAWDITAAGDQALNFPLWGAMGGAVMMGLGLALAQPEKRVLVITGDGEQLMGLGSFATIGVQQPNNLALVVIDNERYGETGMQATHTAYDVDLSAIAAGAGWPVCETVHDQEQLHTAVPLLRHTPGPVCVVIKVKAESPPLVLPPKDGAYLKDRFRLALLGPEHDDYHTL